MFRNVEVLHPRRHAGVRYLPAHDFTFARTVTTAPLTASEIPLAGREYPVVFADSDPLTPVALLSLEPGRNLFVDDTGAWTGGYLPAHLRRYPFALGESSDGEQWPMVIDRAAPQLAARPGEGEPLFVWGEPPAGGVLRRVRDFLITFHRDLRATERLIEPLRDAGLLIPRRITRDEAGTRAVAVEGFFVVDAEALGRLDDATLGAWMRSGLLSLVFAHLQSLAVIERLASRVTRQAG